MGWGRVLLTAAAALSAAACAGGPGRLSTAWGAGPTCAAPADCGAARVHVFRIHGLDPLDLGGLRALRDHIDGLGFCQTHYGQCYEAASFESEILCLRRQQPGARVAVIGFSLGARKAWGLAQALQEQGATLDLLVCLDGKGLAWKEDGQPLPACRVVNVVAPAFALKAPCVQGAQNVYLSGVWHYGTPTHPQTLAAIDDALTALAAPRP
jgi:hypothetical protein